MTALPDDTLDLLAAYALGALEPDEIAQVSALLAEHPELRATVAELRATADRLPYGLPEAVPPPDLRQRVLDRATGRANVVQAAAAPALRRTRAWIWSLAGLAAVALVFAVIGWGQLVNARAEQAQAQAQVGTAQTQLSQLQKQMAEAEKVLASMQGQLGNAAIVQTHAGSTLLVAQLPALSAGQVYQLWRIQPNREPASAGLFTVNQNGYGETALITTQYPASGDTVAITVEPAGGSDKPTSKPLIFGTSV